PRVPPQEYVHLLRRQQQPQLGKVSGPPSVSGFSVPMGPPGQWLYVHGANFVPGETKLYFVDREKTEAEPFVYSDGSLGVTVPVMADTYVKIEVVTPYGSAVSD